MIICSVTCTETLPIVNQSLFGTGWKPIVISTIAIAFFAELLPQYLIPRRATLWAYYCWPFIWGCMWLTCIISWPLSFVLDKLAGPQERGVYSVEQLHVLIKLHERTTKHGGVLGPDTGRIMRGALGVEGRMLRGNMRPGLEISLPEADIERGNITKNDIIVPWMSVQTINIDEEVTKELVEKVKRWAYSRIPVVGHLDNMIDLSSRGDKNRNECKVYGFLHMKVRCTLLIIS